MKKALSIEDIAAALDDIIDENQYLKENSNGVTTNEPLPPSSAGKELDALTLALQGFPRTETPGGDDG